MAQDEGPARRIGCIDSYKDASPSHIITNSHSYLGISHLPISVNSQFVFKMPSSTNGSLDLLTYPPEHKDIPNELYTTGVPLIAERIFSLLNPTDLCIAACKSVQHGTIMSSLFPNSWTKSLPTEGSARRMLKTIMHLRSRWRSLCFPLRGNHLLPSPPNTLTQIQTKETCSSAVSFKCIKPVWHKSGCSGRVSPSKRPRQSEDICGTKEE